jgi:hypothetical protein
MGYYTMYGACLVCHRLFTFNPMRVPSIRVNGIRQPVCLDCMTRANDVRQAKGLDPLPILDGAYDAADESEMVFDDD